MKSMQMMIFSYYQLRKHWEAKIRNVQMVSAGQKIATALHPENFKLPDTIKKGYALNKWKAVQYGNMYIRDSAILTNYMKQYKKADDAHDAMLHIVAWLRKSEYAIESLTADPTFKIQSYQCVE
jgi:hypothetical protein